jgi:hypothetical protein
MNPKPSTDSRTRLSETNYKKCMAATIAFLNKKPSIRNRELREVAGIDYDQAITFFNRAILEKSLVREGKSIGTHYILPSPSKH